MKITRFGALKALALAAVTVAMAGCFDLVSFSPDGKSLAFVFPMGNKQSAIFVTDGRTAVPIGSGRQVQHAKFSPDGSRLLSMSQSGMSVVDYPSGRTRTAWSDDTSIGAWRPDGKLAAAVISGSDGNSYLRYYDLTEFKPANKVKLPTVSGRMGYMQWLPETDGVAYLSDLPGDVYRVEAGQVKRLSTTGDVVGLSITADGKRLRWVRQAPNIKKALLSVYEYDLRLWNVQRIAALGRVPEIYPVPNSGPSALNWVTPSNRGDRLAVCISSKNQATGEVMQLFVMNLDGSQAKKLLEASGDGAMMLPTVWSPGDTSVALIHGNDKVSGVTWVDVMSGKVNFKQTLETGKSRS